MKRNSIIFGLCYILIGGALLQSCEDDNTTTSVTYSTDIAPIMTNYCLTCHSGAAPEAGLNLDNYTDVKAAVQNGQLVDRVNDANSPMPPSGLMSITNREKIEDWIDGGYLE